MRLELQTEKNKNGSLSKENNQLRKQIFQLMNQLNQQNIFQNINNQNNATAIKMIKEKEDVIKDLNETIKRYPFTLEKNEKIMSIIFCSASQKINYSLVCKNTDTIRKLEEELYKEYPYLCENENLFLYKGKILNKFQTLEKNKIKNGDNIILDPNENSSIFSANK